MLTRLYEGLMIILVVLAAGVVGYVYWNRETLFNNFIPSKTTEIPENFSLKSVKIESNWLSYSQNIRNKKLLVRENLNPILYAAGLNNPQKMLIIDTYVVVTEPNTGNIVILEDINGDTAGDIREVFDSNLNSPYDLSYYSNDLYVTTASSVLKYSNFLSQLGNNTSDYEVIVNNLPSSGLNKNKSIVVGPDNKIFVGVGSSCNDCIEVDKRRASVLTYDLEGNSERIYASGIRYATDLEFVRGRMFFVEQGTNKEGVQDEFNELFNNEFYGWPYYSNEGISNETYSTTVNSTQPLTLMEELYNLQSLEYKDESFLFTLINANLENTYTGKVVRYTDTSDSLEELVLFNKDYIEGSPTCIHEYLGGFLVCDSSKGYIYYIN